MESLYSKQSAIVTAFHGCDVSIANKVVLGQEMLRKSNHDYDWLGHGIYFWENDVNRAMQWAIDNAKRPNSSIKEPGVLGAFLDLGYCLDLTNSACLQLLKEPYQVLKRAAELTGLPLPKNVDPLVIGDRTKDRILRKLDCAVIETLHQLNKVAGLDLYDSVRGVFWEGEELYPGAGFREKNHIQIAIINPNCIKGFFIPRELDRQNVAV